MRRQYLHKPPSITGRGALHNLKAPSKATDYTQSNATYRPHPTTAPPGSTAVNGAITQAPATHTAAPPRYKGADERLQRSPPHLMANNFLCGAQVPAGAIKHLLRGRQMLFCSFTWSGIAYLESHQTQDEAVTLLCHCDHGFNPSFTGE